MKNGVEHHLFIAATSQNDGKTTVSLGLYKALQALGESIGFIKPVGQRYEIIDGQQIDKDSILLQKVCGLTCKLRAMSPIAVDRDFTRKYLDDPEGQLPALEQAIYDSFADVASDKDMVIIEGTGHAGVGSVYDLSNARLASMLKAKAIIVTIGGIGRPVDEVALNHVLFEKANVEVIGVIANKVQPDKLEQTRDYLTKAFSRRGLALLGTIPHVPLMTWPTVGQVAKAINAKVINGHQNLSRQIDKIVVGAMTAHNAFRFITGKALLVVPGDRDDVVLAAIATDLLRKDIELSGIVLTGGMSVSSTTNSLIMRTAIPVLTVDMPTYETTSILHNATFKITDTDEEKIEGATSLVRQYVDVEALWKLLTR
jgi:BioD-like phosphotransacetylase family protein